MGILICRFVLCFARRFAVNIDENAKSKNLDLHFGYIKYQSKTLRIFNKAYAYA